jgi:hypothetical protein
MGPLREEDPRGTEAAVSTVRTGAAAPPSECERAISRTIRESEPRVMRHVVFRSDFTP